MRFTFSFSVLAYLSVAQHGAVSAPLGALHADGLPTEAPGTHSANPEHPLGALRTFDLFFPETPQHYTSSQYSSTPAVEITEKQQAVQVYPLPIPIEEEERKAYIPVIHLPEESQNKEGKITSDTVPTFLDMFPEDLLDSDKIVKPIQIHIIEHEDYIDYEIEFVELSMDPASDIGDYTFPASKADSIATDNQYVEDEEPTLSFRNNQTTWTQDYGVTGSSFLELLKRARIRHKEKINLSMQSLPGIPTNIPIQQTNKNFRGNILNKRPFESGKSPRKIELEEHQLLRNSNRNFRNKTKQIKRVKQAINISNHNNHWRSSTPSSLSETKVSTEITTVRSSEILDNIENGNTNRNIYENNTSSLPALNTPTVATRIQFTLSNVHDDTRVTEDTTIIPTTINNPQSPSEGQTTTSYNILETTTIPDEGKFPKRTTTLSLIDELKRQLIHISESKDNPNFPTDSQLPKNKKMDKYFATEDLEPSGSRSIFSPDLNIKVSTQMPQTTIISFDQDIQSSAPKWPEGQYIKNGNSDKNNRPADIPTNHFETNEHFDNLNMMSDLNITSSFDGELNSTSVPNETKTILQYPVDESQILETKNEEMTIKPEDVVKGFYHESNPGQYHEVNPGQYHEINPGQDHEIHPGQDMETNPGQYHEINPGQYHESNPGQYKEEQLTNKADIGVDNVTVDFDQDPEQDTKIYNVKANAGDFIIGEVGRIDISSGQTLQGVRYTALEGEVDQARISDILERFFGARTS